MEYYAINGSLIRDIMRQYHGTTAQYHETTETLLIDQTLPQSAEEIKFMLDRRKF